MSDDRRPLDRPREKPASPAAVRCGLQTRACAFGPAEGKYVRELSSAVDLSIWSPFGEPLSLPIPLRVSIRRSSPIIGFRLAAHKGAHLAEVRESTEERPRKSLKAETTDRTRRCRSMTRIESQPSCCLPGAVGFHLEGFFTPPPRDLDPGMLEDRSIKSDYRFPSGLPMMCRCAKGDPFHMMYAPRSRCVVGSPVAFASKGHKIIQCGPMATGGLVWSYGSESLR